MALIGCDIKWALLMLYAGLQSRHAESFSDITGTPLMFANLLDHTNAGQVAQNSTFKDGLAPSMGVFSK